MGFGLEEQDWEEYDRFRQSKTLSLSGFSALRQWSFAATANLLGEERIAVRGNVPVRVRKGSWCLCGEAQSELETTAGILCRNLLYEHELKKPLPLFLKTLTPDWMQMLEASTSSFFEQQLTAQGKGSFSPKNVKSFCQNGNLRFILVSPEFTSPEVEELWFRAVWGLKNNYFSADILLFCRNLPDLMADCGMECMPIEDLKNDLVKENTAGEEK